VKHKGFQAMPSDPALPLMSIGVPVYNGERHLRVALDSALAQNYANIEILISDNASTDGTEAIARHYARSEESSNKGALGLPPSVAARALPSSYGRT